MFLEIIEYAYLKNIIRAVSFSIKCKSLSNFFTSIEY